MKKVRITVQTYTARDYGNERDETWFAIYVNDKKVADDFRVGDVAFDLKLDDRRKTRTIAQQRSPKAQTA